MDSSPPATAAQGLGPLGPKAQLTCEMCKRRKIKCDKLRPCTACRNAGTVCVPVERARLPRGRSGGRKKKYTNTGADSNVDNNVDAKDGNGVNGNGDGSNDLKERMSMLEHTVQGLVHSGQASYGSAEGGMSVLPGFSLWDVGMELAENRLLNENNQPSDSHMDTWLNTVSPMSEPEDEDKELHHRRQIMSIYMERVESLIPILHRGSFGDYLISRKPYLEYDADHPAPAALAYAVRYLAIGTISDDQCFHMFGVNRESLLARSQKTTQSALEKADYISTEDLTTLQAFVLFVLAVRTHGQGRRAWTMLGLALRIAQSISLHEPEPPFPVKPMEREMRHRLWHVIGILDIQAAFDRGSEPMLRLNCALSEISSSSKDGPDSPFSIMQPDDVANQFLHADTRFLAIMAEAQCAFRALDVSELNAPETMPAYFDTKRRQHVATTFRQKSLAHLPDPQTQLATTQLDWCLRKLVNIVHAFLQLLSFRPIRSDNKNPVSSSAATRRGSGLLLLTVKFLQALDQFRRDERSEPFRWFIRLFSPWYVLVVAVDEADACEDVLLRENCRALIERFLASFQDMMTDMHRGMLQRPVERLMAFGWGVPGMGNPFGGGQSVLPNS